MSIVGRSEDARVEGFDAQLGEIIRDPKDIEL